jgi:hypothetical protein
MVTETNCVSDCSENPFERNEQKIEAESATCKFGLSVAQETPILKV